MINNGCDYMTLDSSKLYDNDMLHLPKFIKDEFKEFPIDENTIFEWKVRENEIILTPRQKVTLKDVVGMIKKEDDTGEEWDIDKEVYL